ncbi:MPS1 [[Candida] subhashii]|uniref:MPS1 n=1 Tax=[Candida] subhashii TaxID=561895 RepID=A0A8J5UXY8_9ASCO|nr:MPS1 [[Candida] subhashii]KAG7663965.1 MPS1 [[Candida] subhashii]
MAFDYRSFSGSNTTTRNDSNSLLSSYSNISFNEPEHEFSLNHKRPFLQDDDKTELPPRLSSYSLAAIHDKPKSHHLQHPSTSESMNIITAPITGKYENDFSENITKFRNKLAKHLLINENNEIKENNPNEFHQRNTYTNSQYSNNWDDFTPGKSNHSTLGKTTVTIPDDGYRPSSQDGFEPIHHLPKRKRRFGKLLGRPIRVSETLSESPMDNPYPELYLDRFSPVLRTSNNEIGSDPIFGRLKESPEFVSRAERPYRETNRVVSEPPALPKSTLSPREVRGYRNRVTSESGRDFDPQKYSFPNILQDINQRKVFDDKENHQYPLPSQSSRQYNSRQPLAERPLNQLNQEPEVFRKPKLPKSHSNIVKSPSPIIQQFPIPDRNPIPESKVHFERPTHSRESGVSDPSDEGAPRNKNIITINGKQYEKRDIIGTGGSSKVYGIRDLSNKRNYAMKKVSIDQYDKSCADKFKEEISLLLKLQKSERIVKLIDFCMTENSIYLIMEKGDGDLASTLHHRSNMKNPPDMCFVKCYAREMLLCLKEVHDAGIVHSDLKPANFLLVKGILKLIDFGIADAVPDHTVNIYRESQIGTPNYMAPETLTVNQPGVHTKDTWKVGKPSDIWSIGCIIYQMIYGKAPYASYSGHQRILAITNPAIKIKYPNKGLGGVRVPTGAIVLMQNCLAHSPNDRWTVEECLDCDFFNPKGVSEGFVREVVHQTINYGYNKRINADAISSDDIEALVNDVMDGISNLNYS